MKEHILNFFEKAFMRIGIIIRFIRGTIEEKSASWLETIKMGAAFIWVLIPMLVFAIKKTLTGKTILSMVIIYIFLFFFFSETNVIFKLCLIFVVTIGAFYPVKKGVLYIIKEPWEVVMKNLSVMRMTKLLRYIYLAAMLKIVAGMVTFIFFDTFKSFEVFNFFSIFPPIESNDVLFATIVTACAFISGLIVWFGQVIPQMKKEWNEWNELSAKTS